MQSQEHKSFWSSIKAGLEAELRSKPTATVGVWVGVLATIAAGTGVAINWLAGVMNPTRWHLALLVAMVVVIAYPLVKVLRDSKLREPSSMLCLMLCGGNPIAVALAPSAAKLLHALIGPPPESFRPVLGSWEFYAAVSLSWVLLAILAVSVVVFIGHLAYAAWLTRHLARQAQEQFDYHIEMARMQSEVNSSSLEQRQVVATLSDLSRRQSELTLASIEAITRRIERLEQRLDRDRR